MTTADIAIGVAVGLRPRHRCCCVEFSGVDISDCSRRSASAASRQQEKAASAESMERRAERTDEDATKPKRASVHSFLEL